MFDYKVRPALVLDLDGTVRKSKSGKTIISEPSDIEIITTTCLSAFEYKKLDYLILGATNQGGVAHGFKSLDQVLFEISDTNDLISEALGTVDLFDEIWYAPSDGKGKIFPYKFKSLLRKPYYGMLAEMEKHYFDRKVVIDWDNSLFVGDRQEDEDCAKSAGIEFMYVLDFVKKHGFQWL